MAFLTVNGWQIHVTNASARRRLRRVGRRERSFRGQLRDASAYVRRSWTVEACLLDPDDAKALEHMLLGHGHFVDLADGLQASTSLMPEPGWPAGITLNPGTYGAHGLGFLRIPASVTGNALAYDAQLGAEWTVIVWRYAGAGDWLATALRSDGSAYRDGEPVDDHGRPLALGGDGLYPRVEGGVCTIVKDSGDEELLDDLTILPYRASDAMLEAVTSTSAGKFGPCSAVRLSGDMVGAHPARILALADVDDIDIVQQTSVRGLGWVNSAALIRFTVDEIDPRFVSAVEVIDTSP